MSLPIKTLLALGRAVSVVCAVVVATGMLEMVGCPLFAAVGEVAFNWASVRSEAEKLRQKAKRGALYQAQVRSAAAYLSISDQNSTASPI
jgi:hypothetical protein